MKLKISIYECDDNSGKVKNELYFFDSKKKKEKNKLSSIGVTKKQLWALLRPRHADPYDANVEFASWVQPVQGL